MPITDGTLAVGQRFRESLRRLTDDQVLDLTRAWVEAWDELSPGIQDSLVSMVQEYPEGALSTAVARDHRVILALDQTEDRLRELNAYTVGVVTGEVPTVVSTTTDAQWRSWLSQLPQRGAATIAGEIGFATATAAALDQIVARTTERINARSLALSQDSREALKRNLVRGIAEGVNPREVGRRMTRDLEGAFNGGLARATRFARTEMLDVHREASRANRIANPAVTGWVWTANLDARTCISCIEMHGTEFPVDQFGPEDHPNGRCSATDKLASWQDLGLDLDITIPGEAEDVVPDARAWFENLTEESQREILGPTRFAQWQTGSLEWGSFSQRVETPDWRAHHRVAPIIR